MHVDVGRRGSWGSPLAIEGAARDLRTGAAGPDEVTVLAEATATADFDEARQLASLVTEPPEPWAEALMGTRAGGGFRRRLDEVVPADEATSLLRQVLDDMPAAALISGYAGMRVARRQGQQPQSLMPPGALERMTDLCAGWRSDGTAVTSVRAGQGVPMQDCPPAPVESGGDAHAWHAMGRLQPDWTRRRRCIDVRRDDDGTFRLWAMFRDTVGEGDGGEVVLHEYTVTAHGVDGVLAEVAAVPRVLPFPECPAAAAAVHALVGSPVRVLAATVPDTLTSISSCTHLNDLLRALGGVADLVAAAAP
jgi:hypothetical protein